MSVASVALLVVLAAGCAGDSESAITTADVATDVGGLDGTRVDVRRDPG